MPRTSHWCIGCVVSSVELSSTLVPRPIIFRCSCCFSVVRSDPKITVRFALETVRVAVLLLWSGLYRIGVGTRCCRYKVEDITGWLYTRYTGTQLGDVQFAHLQYFSPSACSSFLVVQNRGRRNTASTFSKIKC